MERFVKTTFRLPEEILKKIEAWAIIRNESFTATLRRMLERQVFLHERCRNDNLLLEDRYGNMRMLIEK